MVEVFKTNVTTQKQAKKVLYRLKQNLPNYKINFDLEDCDNILRVQFSNGIIDNILIIKLTAKMGFYIEPFLDEPSKKI